MFIESVQIKNYRQYLDDKIIFAKPDGIKNFTIIQGANGAGKTNLLNAITWCLYGTEKHLPTKHKGLPIINMSNFDHLRSDKIIDVEVEIIMLDDDMNRIIFKRTLGLRKTSDGQIRNVPDSTSPYPDGSKFEIIRQIKNEMEIISSPKYILNQLIPESLEEYFFFDGERLNDYFKDNSGKIREEVFKISQLDLLEVAIKHLKAKQKDFLNESGKLSPQAERIREQVGAYSSSLERHEEKLKEKIRDKNDASKKEKEYSEHLRNCDITDISELQKKRDELSKYLETIEDDLEDVETRKLDYIINMAPSLFIYDSIVKSSKLISTKEEAGDIPSDYKRHFIEKLLDMGTCICGMDISKNNEFRENVVKILDHCDKISDISEQLIKEDANLRSIIKSVQEFAKQLKIINKEYTRLEDNKKRSLKAYTDASGKIESYEDIEKIKLWESKRKEYADLKDELSNQIGRNEALIKSTELSIEKYKNNLNKELDKEDKYKKLKQILGFCEKGLKEINAVKSAIMEDFRKEVEEQTKKQFFELIWKKENYLDVNINENYDLSVMHQSGWEGTDTLSAGERQVLALSFMAALNNVSGFDVPIIIDTPLGRISKEPKKNIAKNLPNYLKNKQVILLVTEEEYTQDVRDALVERVGKEYRIYFDETQGTSKVIPYAG